MATKKEPSGLAAVTAWIALLWLIELTDVIVTRIEEPGHGYTGGWLDVRLGIVPRTIHGLLCIPTAPLMHAGWAHLMANSLALAVLGWICCSYSRKLTVAAVGYSVLYSGILTWAIGDANSCHVGASGVIFGLIGFLIGNGVFRRGFLPLLIGVVTAVLFAGALPAALPQSASSQTVPISWQMHLGGLLGGLSAAWHLRKEKA